METLQKIDKLKLTPTSWGLFPDIDEVQPLSDDDYEVLHEIRNVLLKHNAVERFGINLLHRHFDLNDDEVLLESTDSDARIQRVEIRPASEIKDSSEIIETQWAFNGEAGMVCKLYCAYNDYAHKTRHASV